jgi:LCP family protein required for cell wall assembly
VAVGVLAVVAVLAAAVAGYAWWTYQRVDRVDLDLAEIVNSEPRNYLVIGSDTRDGVSEEDPNSDVMLGTDIPAGQRSDSIAILRIDPGSDRIDVLSIPRDLWVTLPDGEEHRINAAYQRSTQTLIDTIDDNLGIPIHHFAEVDFVGFQQIIDALGGVPLYLDAPVRDANSGLDIPESGCVVLDGPQGLAFARSRNLQWKDATGWRTDPTGDLGRMTRQQVLMRAALTKSRSLGLNNIATLKGLVDAALSSTTIDSGLGLGDILALGKRFADFDPQRLQTHSLAVEPDRTSAGASIVRLDEEASSATLSIFRGSTAPGQVTTTTVPPPAPGDITVSVYNGGNVTGEARRVSYVLSDGGFGIDVIETAEEPASRTTVTHAPGGEGMAELVGAWIGPEPRLLEDDRLSPGEVVVTLGSDFETVSEPADAGGDSAGGDERGTDGADTSGSSGQLASGSDGITTGDVAAGATAGGDPAPSSTTTTTVPGWTPSAAPEGVDCS